MAENGIMKLSPWCVWSYLSGVSETSYSLNGVTKINEWMMMSKVIVNYCNHSTKE